MLCVVSMVIMIVVGLTLERTTNVKSFTIVIDFYLNYCRVIWGK
jgi:hypothetical protein